MSGGSETVTTEQTREPWGPAADLIKSQVLPGLQAFGQTPQQYMGPSYIAPGQQYQQGMQGLQGYFGGGAQAGVIDPTMQAWQASLDPSAFMRAPEAFNPLDTYAMQVGRALDENIRPGYATGAIGAGQYGGYSSQRAKNEARATRDAQEAISRYGAGLTSDLYQRGMQASQAAQGMAPGMYQLGMSPYQGMMGLDQMQRGEAYQQQGMERAAADFAQRAPLLQAQDLFGILGPAANLGGTMIGTQTREQDLGFGNFLGPIASLGLGAMSGGFGGFGGLGGLFGGGGGRGMDMGLGYYGPGYSPSYVPPPPPQYSPFLY